MQIVTAASGQAVMHRVVNGIEGQNRWWSLFEKVWRSEGGWCVVLDSAPHHYSWGTTTLCTLSNMSVVTFLREHGLSTSCSEESGGDGRSTVRISPREWNANFFSRSLSPFLWPLVGERRGRLNRPLFCCRNV
ncbi:hypothetical protein E2C01_087478 [Portunus trituberculatus]|uniref:Uncharacterized protein n=1 Tax=Portunus trituberculatus TaxID=210409 RepID=A0A5B7J6P1_PORTR|nr:hypothetical protein [Portunus trituberculatus]